MRSIVLEHHSAGFVEQGKDCVVACVSMATSYLKDHEKKCVHSIMIIMYVFLIFLFDVRSLLRWTCYSFFIFKDVCTGRISISPVRSTQRPITGASLSRLAASAAAASAAAASPVLECMRG